MKNLYLATLVASLLLACAPVAQAQVRGVSFIGVSNTGPSNTKVLADAVGSSSGKFAVNFLPEEFNPDAPYASATTLATKVATAWANNAKNDAKNKAKWDNSRLTLGVYLKWFPHDAAGQAESKKFFGAFGQLALGKTLSPSEQELVTEYRSRVFRFLEFKKNLPATVDAILVPVLEDTCTDIVGYHGLLGAIAWWSTVESTYGMPAVRRSCLVGELWGYPESWRIFFPGLVYEFHGEWSGSKGVKKFAKSGDSWSNDGTKMSVATYKQESSAALKAGVSAYGWHKDYNGTPYERDNQEDREISPFFTKSPSRDITARTYLKAFLSGQ